MKYELPAAYSLLPTAYFQLGGRCKIQIMPQ
jgi:hypothetical protein